MKCLAYFLNGLFIVLVENSLYILTASLLLVWTFFSQYLVFSAS